MDGLSSLIGGVIPPIATPLTEQGTVDDDSLRRLTESLISAGVAGLFALGSTGEAAYLTNGDRLRVASTVAEAASGRVPLVIGLVDTTAKRVVDAAGPLSELGPAAFVVTGPFYARADEDEIRRHYEYVASHLTVPVLAYNIPTNVGYAVQPATFARLIRDQVVRGVKDSSPHIDSLAAVIGDEPQPGALYLTGSDVALAPALRAGANGAVAGLSNLAPGLFARALAARTANDWSGLDAVQETISRLAGLYTPTPGSGGLNSTQLGSIKTALRLLDRIATDQVSVPMRRTPPDRVHYVRDVLVQAGLLPGAGA